MRLETKTNRRILVIDDSATYRRRLAEALEEAGYQVDEAVTGEEGLSAVAAIRPAAVIVDGILPGIDGATVVRRLKSDASLRSTPCVLLTAAEGDAEELRSLEAGADTYLRKSEDLGLILARLAALLRHAQTATSGAMPSLLGPKRLLAVDDSPTYLHALAEQLEHDGHQVTLAESGEEALDVLRIQPVDCILMDLIMPGLSGQDACRRIKESSEWRDIPLVMLTAHDDRDAMIEGINAGADDYIAKTSDFEVIKARVRAQLRRKHFEDETRASRERQVRQETEARFQRLIHSNIIGVIFGDLEGQLTGANDAFLDMLGFTRADLESGKLRWGALTPPEWRDRDLAAVAELRRAGSVAPFEKELICKDRRRLPVMVGLVLPQASETVVGFVLNRSEQKEAEEKIKRYTLALEAANRDLARAKEQAEQSSRAKSSFLANMSHELRTPLNAIIGFAELLYDGQVPPDTPEHREFLGDILKSGRHLLQLINDILDLSKVEAGKLEFHPEPIVLGGLVQELIATLRTVAAERQIRIETEIHPAVAEIVADPARLRQVLYNYLSNALKFTPEGGQVLVRAVPEGIGAFRLSVEDSGVGIAPRDVERLFAEFEQLDTGTAKRHAGTGLGLALTKKLVEAQGGTVGVMSVLGSGSTFHAILPKKAALGQRLPLPRVLQSSAEDAPVVLVVEDSESDQALIVRALAEAGYSVETAATGAQAIARCKERAFDAITLDLMLPDVSGFDVLRAIRSEGRNREAPVVVVTGFSERGMLSGFAVEDVLGKPLDDGALLASLQRAGASPERGGVVLVVDDDPGSSKLMEATLIHSGYQVECARDPEAGLRVAERAPPAVVVLDLLMPGLDGFGFLEALRKTERCENVPVIVWTSKDVSQDEYERLAASARGVVQKGQGASLSVMEEIAAVLSGPRRKRSEMRG